MIISLLFYPYHCSLFQDQLFEHGHSSVLSSEIQFLLFQELDQLHSASLLFSSQDVEEGEPVDETAEHPDPMVEEQS